MMSVRFFRPPSRHPYTPVAYVLCLGLDRHLSYNQSSSYSIADEPLASIVAPPEFIPHLATTFMKQMYDPSALIDIDHRETYHIFLFRNNFA